MRYAMGALLVVILGACSDEQPAGQANQEQAKAQEIKQAAPQPTVEQGATASISPDGGTEPNLETETDEQLAEMEAGEAEIEAMMAEQKAQAEQAQVQPVKTLENFKVKGFWLGMPFAEAEALRERLCKENGVETDEIAIEEKDGVLNAVGFGNYAIEGIFGAKNVNPPQFAQLFVDAYGDYVPRLDVSGVGPNGEMTNQTKWEYFDTSLGFRVRVWGAQQGYYKMWTLLRIEKSELSMR